MKKLLLKHGKVILGVLMKKYDKQCHLKEEKICDTPKSNQHSKQTQSAEGVSIIEERDEFLAGIIGQLIRLYSKSKSLSQCFCHFEFLDRLVGLMKHEQYLIQSCAQKTFDAILKGPRVYENTDGRPDAFVEWIDQNTPCGTDSQGVEMRTHERLNILFRSMRQDQVYTFKRHSMKLQYEILSLGLKSSMIALAEQHKNNSNVSQNRKDYEDIVPTQYRG